MALLKHFRLLFAIPATKVPSVSNNNAILEKLGKTFLQVLVL